MDAMQRITRARARMVLTSPFYATLALGLKVEERPEIGTMATDGANLFYAPEFIATCDDDQLIGLLAHEVMHVANLHHTRRGDRDPELWNVACDYVINGDLLREGFKLPDGGCVDAQYDGLSAEDVFAMLQPAQKGQKPAPGGVMDAAPGSDPATLQAIEMDTKAKVIQAAQAAKMAGKETASSKRLYSEIRNPAIDWRAVLRRYVDSAARVTYEWHRPNRRHVAADVYLPGKVHDGMGRLAVVIDTSGSIDVAAFDAFMAELQGAADDAAPECVEVIQCDTQVTDRQEFGHGDAIKVALKGGGGTDLRPAIALCKDASAVVVFTDGYFNWAALADPGAPVLWALWGGYEPPAVPFGEVMAVPSR